MSNGSDDYILRIPRYCTLTFRIKYYRGTDIPKHATISIRYPRVPQIPKELAATQESLHSNRPSLFVCPACREVFELDFENFVAGDVIRCPACKKVHNAVRLG